MKSRWSQDRVEILPSASLLSSHGSSGDRAEIQIRLGVVKDREDRISTLQNVKDPFLKGISARITACT